LPLLIGAGLGPAAAEQPRAADQGRCGSVDLVVAIDTTHSMHRSIREMKQEALRLIDLIAFVSAGDYRLGLISFRDDVTVEVDLGTGANHVANREAVVAAINRLDAEGGMGGPEASDEALRTAILNLPADGRRQTGDFSGPWEARSRILVIITDNLPGGFDDKFQESVDAEQARALTGDALDRDIRISSIFVPSLGFQLFPQSNGEMLRDNPRVAEIMRAYPQLTGGIFAATDRGGRGTADAIADIISRCGQRPIS
jgi:hypothetical protein